MSLPIALRSVASAQSGLFTRAQAMEAGCRGPEIRQATAPSGRWAVVRRGVYVDRDRWDGADEARRALLRDLAVHLSMRVPHALSHDSAARMLGLAMLRPDRPWVHVTRRGVGGSRSEAGVKHHLSRERPSDVRVTAAGVPHVGPARTVLDIAREHGAAAGVVVMDQVLRRGVDPEELRSEVALMRSWPGVRAAREALALADSGAENLGESLARLLVVEALPGIELRTQFPVRIPNGVAWVDVLAGRLAVELDGRAKYLSVEDGGVATGPVADVVVAEKTREAGVVGDELLVCRIGFAELWGAARRAAVSRVRGMYAQAVRAYGVSPSAAQLEFAARLEQQRSVRLRAA